MSQSMTPPQVYVLLILVVTLLFVFMNRLREDIAALVIAVALGIAQLLGLSVLGTTSDDASKALTGFGTPEVITLMSLFIITYCLDKYGVTRWLAGRLLAIGGNSERRLIGLFTLTAALLSLFMNTLAAGALVLPTALDASRRTQIKPSKFLIPIAYGAMLGGAATYLTTANIIISGLLPLAHPPQPPLNFFDFTPVGGCVALVGIAFITLFSNYLLPNHEPPPTDTHLLTHELLATYQLEERLWELIIPPSSPLIGQELHAVHEQDFGLTILGIQRDQRIIPAYRPEYRLQGGDILLVVGRKDRLEQLSQQQELPVQPHHNDIPVVPNTILVEIIIPPRTTIEGKTLRELAFRARYGFTAVALWRNQRSYRTDVSLFELHTGDSLLLIGSQERLKDLQQQQDFVVMQTTAPETLLDVKRVGFTIFVTLAAIGATLLGVPVALAMLTGATMLLSTGLLKPEEAYSAIKWRAIFLIAGTITLSVAMVHTQLATMLGTTVVDLVRPYGKSGLVAGAYLLSAGLTQFMGGQISPLVAGPITISAALHLGVNPQAVAVVTAIASSVSFITPLSHPINILMIAPANYTFRDFLRSGLPLTVVCFIVLMLVTPIFWQL